MANIEDSTASRVPDVGPTRIIYGCMGLGGTWDAAPYGEPEVEAGALAVDAALELGITWLDTADIYRNGKSESVLGDVLAARPSLREQVRIQTKCGIRSPGNTTDASVLHYREDEDTILASVEGSLSRLRTDHLDSLLLHRPSPLIDRAGTARALDRLVDEGTVGAIGVSNFSHHQMAALQAHLDHPLVADQLQLSLGHRDFVETEILVNDPERPVVFPAGTLEYAGAHGVQVQAWSPLAGGAYDPEREPSGDVATDATRVEVAAQAAAAGVAPAAIVLAWLLRHPAGIVPVIGSSRPERIREARGAAEVADAMTDEAWWRLFTAARGADAP